MKWLVLLLLTACSISTVRSYPTLLVVNNSMSPIRVYDNDGFLVGRSYPGERACLTLQHQAVRGLVFTQLGDLVIGPVFFPFGHAGWSVILHNNLKFDVLNLQPADPCK